MSLVFDHISDEAQTHALVIGVGGYRHLPGGMEPGNHVLGAIGILKQLTSPPRSALAFTSFLKEKERLWRAPLGSIELLISPSPEDPAPDGIPAGYEAATYDNIAGAYLRWKERCNKNRDNIAILFFSGHGAEKTDQYLLAEDFGKTPNNVWRESFSLDATISGFSNCLAETQCFFIDACRKVTSSMLDQNLIIPGLDVESYTSSTESRYMLSLKAAAHNESAHGKKFQSSIFTQALLRALGGGIATNSGQGWIIETGEFGSKINKIIGSVKSSEGYPQRCITETSDTTTLLQLEDRPDVELEIRCKPNEAMSVAKFSCSGMEVDFRTKRKPALDPWKLNVKAGIYKINADFSTDEYHSKEGLRMASPPSTKHELDVSNE